MEPQETQTGNSQIGPQRASATYVTHLPALQRRERFARKHPEIDIRAKRENGRMCFYVREPGRSDPAVWTDANEMMDDLEARYP